MLKQKTTIETNSVPLGFNSVDEENDSFDLNEPINEAPKSEESPKKLPDLDIDIESIMPFITGFLGSLGNKKEEAKTEYNTDNSSNECTKNISFNFNFGDVRVHQAK